MKYLSLLLLIPAITYAGGNHGHSEESSTIINNTTNITYKTTSTVSGMALGLAASQHNFDLSTYAYQWSIGAAYYDNEDAISFALGKRINNILINGSIGYENGTRGAGIGVNGRF